MAKKKYVSLSSLQTFLENIKTKFAAISHKHKISDITDYTVDTALSSTSTNPVQNKVIDAEFDAMVTAMNALDLAIDGKADSTHNHNNLYYTETEVDTKLVSLKNDLLNGAGAAYDTLKELGDLIDDNTDAIDALEAVASGKADKTHTHAISDVSGLQSALDGKAASSHGTHVSYSTTAPAMDGTASVGSASTVARSDHKHPTDTSRAAKTDLDSHTGNTTIHITATERTNWNAAKTTAESAKTRADSAYTLAESKVDSLSDLGITATATELNYMDGVTSNVQEQLDNKANENHKHSWGELQNKPFGDEIESEETLMSNKTISMYGDGWYRVTPVIELIEGVTYKVTFNGTVYESVAWVSPATGTICIGNGEIYGGENYGDLSAPFAFEYANGTFNLYSNDLGSATFSIVKVVADVTKLDDRFIPDTIARASAVSQVQIVTWEEND